MDKGIRYCGQRWQNGQGIKAETNTECWWAALLYWEIEIWGLYCMKRKATIRLYFQTLCLLNPQGCLLCSVGLAWSSSLPPSSRERERERGGGQLWSIRHSWFINQPPYSMWLHPRAWSALLVTCSAGLHLGKNRNLIDYQSCQFYAW